MSATSPKSEPKPEQKPARKPVRKKATVYCIEIWNRRIKCCYNALTGERVITSPLFFKNKEQTVAVDDWLVKLCERRDAFAITCKNDVLEGDLLCATTVPMRSGNLYLFRGFDDVAIPFLKEPDYGELLRQRGIFNIVRSSNINVEYSGKWRDAWATGTGKSKIPDQDLFWAMSDEIGATCQIDSPSGRSEVITPRDDQLPLYDGQLFYHPQHASWVVTYEMHRHHGSVSSGATLYITPERELDEVIVQLDSFLKSMNYRRFDDCLKMVTYLDYATNVDV